MKMKSGFDLVFPVLSSYVMSDNFHKAGAPNENIVQNH